MNYLLYFVILIFVVINSFAKAFSREAISMSNEDVEKSKDIPIKGSVFISTVYPCVELDSNLIDMIDYIDRAYGLDGKEVLESIGSNEYYPAPLSYPYKFSENGITTIIKNLNSVENIDRGSVKIRSFPNIHKHEQHLFRSNLEKILIEEEYIYFKIDGWHNIHFMKFPTFVVMNFDFTDPKAISFRDYEKYKAYWREKTKEFTANEILTKVLGVSRQKHEWSPIPQLVFISLDSYRDERFMNRYFPWGSDESINIERQYAFLRELSLIIHPEDLSLSSAILRHFENISHEYYISNIWRFYYFPYHLFYDGNAFTVRGSQRYMARILRSVLFAHVVLPYSADKLRSLENKIKMQVPDLRDKRLEFSNVFEPKKITGFRTRLEHENRIFGEMEKGVERIKEAQNGAKKMFLHFENPGRSLGFPLDHPAVQVISRFLEGYRKLLHFEEPVNAINDRRVVEKTTNELDSLVSSFEKALSRYDNEIKSSMVLIENRNALLWSRGNTLLALILPAAGAIIGVVLYFCCSLWFINLGKMIGNILRYFHL
jgi:hypothetical protein